jgi:hypothetical protein
MRPVEIHGGGGGKREREREREEKATHALICTLICLKCECEFHNNRVVSNKTAFPEAWHYYWEVMISTLH